MDENILREVIARIMADPRLQPLLAAAAAKSSVQKPNCLVVIENETGSHISFAQRIHNIPVYGTYINVHIQATSRRHLIGFVTNRIHI